MPKKSVFSVKKKEQLKKAISKLDYNEIKLLYGLPEEEQLTFVSNYIEHNYSLYTIFYLSLQKQVRNTFRDTI